MLLDFPLLSFLTLSLAGILTLDEFSLRFDPVPGPGALLCPALALLCLVDEHGLELVYLLDRLREQTRVGLLLGLKCCVLVG